MSVRNRNLENARNLGKGYGIQPSRLSDDIRKRKYVNAVFGGEYPSISSSVGAAPTAAQGQIDTCVLPGITLELFQTTAQTLYPVANDLGLEIALDQVNNESVEYVPGGNTARNPYAFTVGTDADFFIRAKFNIPDASGSDQFGIGFRKQAAYAVPTSFLTTGDGTYTDYVLFGFAATSADPNPVSVSSDINDSGSATVGSAGFTWADNKTHELKVQVAITGICSFFINGVKLGGTVSLDGDGAAITAQNTTGVATVTLDSGDVMIPFIFCRQDADITTIFLRELEIGKDENISASGAL